MVLKALNPNSAAQDGYSSVSPIPSIAVYGSMTHTHTPTHSHTHCYTHMHTITHTNTHTNTHRHREGASVG
jgi:hypothetical protein